MVQDVTPDAIMQLGFGYWGSKTLLTAVELGLFTELVSLASKLALNCSCLLCWMERRVLFLDSISRGPCVDEDRMS